MNLFAVGPSCRQLNWTMNIIKTERCELQLGLPAGSWWKLVVNGSMLEIVRPVLELLWVSWALGRDGNKCFLNTDMPCR